MSNRPRITATIITLDEEKNLAELLPALSWVDEIVVVDGGSSDATLEIARRHGCRAVSRRFDTFARQRNHALGLAGGDWVLSIDADERPTRRLCVEIRRRIATARHAAFRVGIRSRIFGRQMRYSGTQDDCPVRLFRRDAGRWVGDVHEVVRLSGRVGRLKSCLRHQTMPDLDAFLRKVHRYTTLEANARVAAGRAPRRRDYWIAPAREVFRRMFWKWGFLDGPAGWAFCILSGLSEWVLADQHHRRWGGARFVPPIDDFARSPTDHHSKPAHFEARARGRERKLSPVGKIQE